MTARISCCVPMCRRTVSADKHPGSAEIICAKHWKLVSKSSKKRRRQLGRRLDRFRALIHKYAGSNESEHRRAAKLYGDTALSWDALWERCKIEAFEREAGIA